MIYLDSKALPSSYRCYIKKKRFYLFMRQQEHTGGLTWQIALIIEIIRSQK
jgi:hypothetical protein